MKPQIIVISNKHGITIHGTVNPVTKRIGNFTVTPDHVKGEYPIVTHAEKRVKQIVEEREKQRRESEEALLRQLRENKKACQAKSA